MRDRRFVAIHRGGKLTVDDHRSLMKWAIGCSRHVLLLTGCQTDERLMHALVVAGEWEKGKIPTGTAMKAARDAHKVAREFSDPVLIATARSVGHAVATAHMADHSLGAALYTLKAMKLSGKPVVEEKYLLISNLPLLPDELKELVLAELNRKIKIWHFDIS